MREKERMQYENIRKKSISLDSCIRKRCADRRNYFAYHNEKNRLDHFKKEGRITVYLAVIKGAKQ